MTFPVPTNNLEESVKTSERQGLNYFSDAFIETLKTPERPGPKRFFDGSVLYRTVSKKKIAENAVFQDVLKVSVYDLHLNPNPVIGKVTGIARKVHYLVGDLHALRDLSEDCILAVEEG